MGEGADASRQVHGQAEVALFGEGRLSRVDAHAHAQAGLIGLGVGGQLVLGLDGRCNRVLGAAEGDEEGIALRVDLTPAVVGERGTEDPAVIREDAFVAVAQLTQ